jgi:hypothetical protein
MPAIVWQDVEALQANLSGVAAAAQMIILAHVNEDLNPNVFGGETSPKYHLARAWLAAHLGDLALRKGQQAVASKTIGVDRITIAYVASSSTGEALKQTLWGEQYLELLAQSPLRIGAGLCR